MPREIKVLIDADSSGFRSEAASAASAIDGFHKTAIAAAAGVAAAWAGKELFGFGKDALNAASNMNETVSKIGVVFGDAAAGVQDWAKGSASAFGQSQQQALDAAATFGVFAKSAGLAGQGSAKFSEDMTQLAGDMASFSNTSPQQAIEAIGSALRGESEPIRAYGVLLDDATVRARALQMGIYDGSGALTQQQRVLATQAEILAQTSLAQGDFSRTQGGMANQSRILAAQWANLKVTAGSALLPIATAVMPQLTRAFASFASGLEGVMPQVVAVSTKIGDTLGRWIGKLVDQLPGLLSGLDGLGATFGRLFDGIDGRGPSSAETMTALRSTWDGLVQAAGWVGAAVSSVVGWFTGLDSQTQKTVVSVAALAAGLGLISRHAQQNPVTRLSFELTGTVLSSTAQGAIGLAFRSLANKIAAMHVTAGVVNVNGGVGGGGGGFEATGSRMGKGFLGSLAAAGVWAAAAAAFGYALKETVSGDAFRRSMQQGANQSTLGGSFQAAGAAGSGNLTAGQNQVALARQQDWPGWMKSIFGVKDALQQNQVALESQQQASDRARFAIDGIQRSLDEQGRAWDFNARTVLAHTESLLGDSDAQNFLIEANAGVQVAMQGAAGALMLAGDAFDAHTAATYANQLSMSQEIDVMSNSAAAARDQIAALEGAGASTTTVTAATNTYRDALIDQAVKLGWNKDQVMALLEQYGLVPPEKRTEVVAEVQDALDRVQLLLAYYSALQSKSMTIDLYTRVNGQAVNPDTADRLLNGTGRSLEAPDVSGATASLVAGMYNAPAMSTRSTLLDPTAAGASSVGRINPYLRAQPSQVNVFVDGVKAKVKADPWAPNYVAAVS